MAQASSASAPVRWHREPVLLLLALLLLIYYRVTPGIFQGKASGDGFFGFMYLPGLVLHHSVDLAKTVPEYTAVLGRERTGYYANACPIGPVFLWLPTYLLGLLFHKLATVPGLGTVLRWLVPTLTPKLSGREAADFFMAGLGSLAATMLGLALVFRLVQRKLGLGAARLGVVAMALATPLCWYAVTQPTYGHAASFLAIAWLLERWDHYRQSMTTWRWAKLGLIGGVALLMRPQEGLWFLLPGLDALVLLLGALRQRQARQALRVIGQGLLFLACAGLVYLPQLLVWYRVYGELRLGQPEGHFLWWNPALLESLFSMRAGLFPWVPVLYLVVPGLLWARRALGGLVWRLGLVFALELWLNASVWDYHASWSYGPRRYTDAVPIVALGVGGLYVTLRSYAQRATTWLPTRLPSFVVGGVVLLTLWNGLLMELVRNRHIKNTSSLAAPASVWVAWAQGPAWLGRALDTVGYPFVQPVGWLYALWYRMPARNFEGLIGNYLLERDWKVHALMLKESILLTETPWYLVEGQCPELPAPPKHVAVGSSVRLVIPLSAREPLRILVSGELPASTSPITATWNGTPIPVERQGAGLLVLQVPQAVTYSRARLNQLQLRGLPEGTSLTQLHFQGSTAWWNRGR